MRGTIILVVIVLVVGYVGTQIGTVYRTKADLTARIDYDLEQVDEHTQDQVRQDLIRNAAKLGVKLAPDRIRILYTDTQQRTYAQQLVGRVAQFVNKQVAISVRYETPVLGFPWRQEIARSLIKQIEVKRKPSDDLNELLGP